MPLLLSIRSTTRTPLRFHCSAVVISVEDRVDRLEACTALLPLEAAELDAQQQAAAVEAEPDGQQEVAAVAPDAQRQEEVTAAQSGLRRPEPSVESAESAAARLWFQAASSLVLAPE